MVTDNRCKECGQVLPAEEHVIVVAFSVLADSREDAMSNLLGEVLPGGRETEANELDGYGTIGWWFAEDDRIVPSDNDSAIFVPQGSQRDLRGVVKSYIRHNTDEQVGYP